MPPPQDGWIDAHVHVWPENETFKPRRFTPEDLLAHARANGVTRIVLIQPGQFHFDNKYMIEAIRKYPGVFSGVAVVESAKDVAPIKKSGVRGFRVTGGFDTEPMKAMWRAAGQEHLAMCPLINPDALGPVGKLCVEFPDTNVVIDHLARIGATGTIEEADVAALCGMAKHPNVYVKVSAFYALGKKTAPYLDLKPLIRRVYDSFGARRLMWGSDGPYQVQAPHNYASSVELVRDHLEFLHGDDKAWLMKRTAEKIFF